jgi:hypothetical protein
MVVFWDVAPWSLVHINRRFRGACDQSTHNNRVQILSQDISHIVPTSTQY